MPYKCILTHDIDILVATESWLQAKDKVIIGQLVPDNYAIQLSTREGRSGGGIAVIHKKDIKVKKLVCSNNASFESLEVLFSLKSKLLRLVGIYRPPASRKNKAPLSQFYEEFSSSLESWTFDAGFLMIVGDFNIHVDNPRDSKACHEILQSMGMVQLVDGPTHSRGHTLDLVILREKEKWLVPSLEVRDHQLSDHRSIFCTMATKKPSASRKTITYRDTKHLDVEGVTNDLQGMKFFQRVSGAESIEDQINNYTNILCDVFDKHAPLCTKKVVERPKTQWYTDKVRALKKERRKAERLWRQTGLEIHKQLYQKARENTNAAITEAKTAYFSSKVSESTHNSKAFFGLVTSFMNNKDKKQLPDHADPSEISEKFSAFFESKINKIRESLEGHAGVAINSMDESHVNSSLTTLEPVTLSELEKIIMKAPSKSCVLDPIPTWLLKKVLAAVLPAIMTITNTSLSTGCVPSSLKKAIITPVLKKPSLDIEKLSNYRPVSNLSFLSKVIERVVASRLTKYMSENKLSEPMQSAFRTGCSTETALLKVQNDILKAMDDNKVVILVLLDLSAAFDTVDHNILIQRLKGRLGLDGAALEWLRSYLSDRVQCVKSGPSTSSPTTIKYGVPQGSVLGPLLFSIYMLPLGEILRRHAPSYHLFADDDQLYIASEPDSITARTKELESCIDEIRQWMRANFLQLNDDKTDVLLIGSPTILSRLPTASIRVGNSSVSTKEVVKNLGILFDKHLDLSSNITAVCKSCYFHLHNISKIRRFLDEVALKRVVHALVISRLDYCNSLLFGLPAKLINRLQRVQNSAARLIKRVPRSQQITPALVELHWLRVDKRIVFKICTIVYRCLHERSSMPDYLCDLLNEHRPQRCLRSSEKELLVCPKSRCRTMGDRAFQCAAPRLWNGLPLHVRQSESLSLFKKKLKTFLFTL